MFKVMNFNEVATTVWNELSMKRSFDITVYSDFDKDDLVNTEVSNAIGIRTINIFDETDVVLAIGVYGGGFTKVMELLRPYEKKEVEEFILSWFNGMIDQMQNDHVVIEMDADIESAIVDSTVRVRQLPYEIQDIIQFILDRHIADSKNIAKAMDGRLCDLEAVLGETDTFLKAHTWEEFLEINLNNMRGFCESQEFMAKYHKDMSDFISFQDKATGKLVVNPFNDEPYPFLPFETTPKTGNDSWKLYNREVLLSFILDYKEMAREGKFKATYYFRNGSSCKDKYLEAVAEFGYLLLKSASEYFLENVEDGFILDSITYEKANETGEYEYLDSEECDDIILRPKAKAPLRLITQMLIDNVEVGVITYIIYNTITDSSNSLCMEIAKDISDNDVANSRFLEVCLLWVSNIAEYWQKSCCDGRNAYVCEVCSKMYSTGLVDILLYENNTDFRQKAKDIALHFTTAHRTTQENFSGLCFNFLSERAKANPKIQLMIADIARNDEFWTHCPYN